MANCERQVAEGLGFFGPQLKHLFKQTAGQVELADLQKPVSQDAEQSGIFELELGDVREDLDAELVLLLFAKEFSAVEVESGRRAVFLTLSQVGGEGGVGLRRFQCLKIWRAGVPFSYGNARLRFAEGAVRSGFSRLIQAEGKWLSGGVHGGMPCRWGCSRCRCCRCRCNRSIRWSPCARERGDRNRSITGFSLCLFSIFKAFGVFELLVPSINALVPQRQEMLDLFLLFLFVPHGSFLHDAGILGAHSRQTSRRLDVVLDVLIEVFEDD